MLVHGTGGDRGVGTQHAGACLGLKALAAVRAFVVAQNLELLRLRESGIGDVRVYARVSPSFVMPPTILSSSFGWHPSKYKLLSKSYLQKGLPTTMLGLEYISIRHLMDDVKKVR